MINDNNTKENNHLFIHDLNVIEQVYNELRAVNMEVVLAGDFNTDLKRGTYNSRSLKDHLMANNLNICEPINLKEIDYTYSKTINGKIQKSRIDHVIAYDASNVKELKIDVDKLNIGDHCALTFTYSLLESLNHNRLIEPQVDQKPALNWTRLDEQLSYSNRVSKRISKIRDKIRSLIREMCPRNIKIKLSNVINEISSTLVEATIKTKNEYENLRRKNRNRHKRKYKINKWWDDELSTTHHNVIRAYIAYKDSNFDQNAKAEYTNARREFRRLKRAKIREKRRKNSIILNNIYKYNRITFWRKLSTLQRNKLDVEIPIANIKEKYERFFNERNPIKHTNCDNNSGWVRDFLEKHKHTTFDVHVQNDQIKNAIDDLPNGKSIGFSSVSNEMFKYADCEELNNMIAVIFSKMINYKTIPYFFNISILKPIIKDEKKQ